MEKIQALISEFRGSSIRRKVVALAVLALIIILVVALCININIRSDIQRKYEAISTEIGDELYSKLTWWAQYTDMTRNPNADIQNRVLPELRQYLVAASTLNDMAVKIYGDKYEVLTEQDMTMISQTLNDYEDALRSGAPTDYVQQRLEECAARVNSLLATRFNDRTLRPSR